MSYAKMVHPGIAPVAQASGHGAGTWVTVEGEDIGYALEVSPGALDHLAGRKPPGSVSTNRPIR